MDVSLRPWSRLLATALLVYLYLGVAYVYAQHRFEGEGRVVAIDEAKGAATLDHGPIPGLMPAMRMAFPVSQVDLLRGFEVGDVVRFSLQPRGPE